MLAAIACLLAGMLFAGSSTAQDATDPISTDPIATDDPLADPIASATTADPAISSWTLTPYGDLILRHDSVQNLANRDDISRFRARGGLRFTRDRVEFAVAVEAAQGTDANVDNRRNNDNERSDGGSLDEAYVRFAAADDTFLTFGQTHFPFATTPLTWDADLRPIGASLQSGWSAGSGRLTLTAGYFNGNHLHHDDSRIAAAQLGYRTDDSRATWGSVHLGFFEFDELDTLARAGMTRTNRRVGPRLVSDYRLADLQFLVRHELAKAPLTAQLDLVRNLGADDQDEGIRASLVYGDARNRPGLELGLSAQRIQRDAVPAAFNEDEWWFHSFARGVMPWVGWGFNEHWSVRAAAFYERRDDQSERIERVLIDLRGQW